ncbi:glycoside hydrolase family 25 protein [Paraburkholderia diazotrophica]|uniref:Lyzozyme M1 (1,4-beta-N-acetylmuramidase), GH25 family n=1 Tax=Paraburkholderia diazotrophica TaxID=667676 RepID=A0A1H7DL29_9BURK|nr:glycoside hydrolase family 25 protein [Paraburkholderia diazotrophica]SEK02541.1 Lyzozyme M1 (1,4-beta-N-acetylmuramidase), GH25 family [Paraburkholderia diazotrophica]
MPVTVAGTIDAIVDLHHDRPFDAAKAKADGIAAVIHKASEGATFKDDQYKTRREAARKAGLLWGAYHFSSGRPVADQVRNFLEAVEWGAAGVDNTGTLLCLDFEPSTSGPDMTLDQAHEFVTAIKNKSGRWPMIYGANMLRDAVQSHGADPILKNCPLWYARYRDQPIGIPVDTWPKFTLWQYTDGKAGPLPQEVNGMGHTDRNCFAGSLNGLTESWPFADYFKSAPSSTDQG